MKAMKRVLEILLLTVLLIASSPVFALTGYVVERERSNLAIFQDQGVTGELTELGKLHHATVKFRGKFGYIISRDGFLSQFDTTTNTVVKKVKVGASSIGFSFVGSEYIAVGNYDPDTVVILNSDLKPVKTIATGSRNVGLKSNGNLIPFCLMDKNEVWILDAENDFQILKKFPTAEMPFDALLAGDHYIVGHFKSKSLGILDLKTLSYRSVALKGSTDKTILKVPHFGMWGLWKHIAFIPAVGESRLYTLSLETLEVTGYIEIPGLPVFASVSPEEKFIAVNFSGEKENLVTIIEPLEMKILKNIDAGQRVMHIRFSPDSENLFVSSYFDNRLNLFKTDRKSVV